MAQLRIGCVVMAAGNARRFGENSWRCRCRARRVFHRALEAVPAEQFVRTVVVSQYPEVLELAHRMGFVPVPTGIRTGASATPSRWGWGSCRRWMRRCFRWRISPAAPGERGESSGLYREHPEHIAALGHGGVRGNPCLVPGTAVPGAAGSAGGSRRQSGDPPP